MTLSIDTLNPSQTTAQDWNNYSLGPQVCMYLGLRTDSEPEDAQSFDEASSERFQTFMRGFIRKNSAVSADELVSLMDEFVHMKMPGLSILLFEQNQDFEIQENFRGLLALGAAGLMEQDFDIAEWAFLQAKKLVPEETAPYVNLAQLYFHRQQDDQAQSIALAGLGVEPNHFRLWEMLALIFQATKQDAAGEALKALADERHSWAGKSLAALLIDADDKLLRCQILDEVFHGGERSAEFLIEYTAALGAASLYDKIPQIVWQAQSQLGTGQSFPWQLWAHAAQAQVAMEAFDQAMPLIESCLKRSDLPEQARLDLEALKQEATITNLETH